ncbi:excalibur calcium-binding domain-containing protein [uncultured Rothia sp.]|uniref:excalibur calcium-binding domain-containing protein n=1 Tax=uncultured Rothia sp. TaxID=316088 RepID=UPI00262D5BF2|nr:excalibur calcium-binding domain-containing protein [uncultured Rothia sp.]
MNIRNNIARIGATALIGCGLVATSVPATFAVEGAPQVVHTYADSAQFIAPDVWVEGQGLNIGGEGFKTADGTSGSVLALKLNKGAVKIDGQDYLEIHADSDGNFSVTIPWQEELHGSVSVDIYLLSGSLKDGDVPRGGKAATVTIKVAEQPAPTEDPTPTPSEDPTPAPTEDSTPAPTQDPTTEPSAEASESASSAPAVEDVKETKPADETSAPAADSSKPADENAAPAPQPSESFRFQNCADVEAAGEAPIRKGHPDFREKFDADGDGIGCEQPVDYENSKKSDSVSLSSSSNDNLGSGSSNASSKSSSSLAKTGASDAMTAAGLGLIALGAGGATIVATRMRKKA